MDQPDSTGVLVFILAEGKSLQRFEGRRGRLLQRRSELLHRSQGFPHLLAEVGGGLVE